MRGAPTAGGLIALALVGVVVCAGGCDILTVLGGGAGLACQTDEACAAGTRCVDGRCRADCFEDLDCHADEQCRQGKCISMRDAGDAGLTDRILPDHGIPDHASPDSAPSDRAAADGHDDLARAEAGTDAAPARCGHLSAMQDDFESDLLPFWDPYAETGATATQQNGLLEIATAVGVAGQQRYAGRYSVFAADLRDDALAIEVVGLDLPSSGAEAFMQFIHDGDNALAIGYANGELVGLDLADGEIAATTRPFEAAAHRWWRIAEHAGTLDLAVSVNGRSWSVFYSTPTASHQLHGYVHIGAGTFSADAAVNGLVQFDNLNFEPGRQSEPWCRASSLRDDFASAAAGDAWSITRSTSTGCSITWSHGLVRVEQLVAVDRWCGIVTRSGYDLEDDSASIEIEARPQRAGVWTMLFVWQAGSLVGLGYDGADLRAEIFDSAGQTLWRSTEIDRGTRQLRIARSGGALQFLAGTATGSWHLVATTSTALHFDAVQVGAQLFSTVSASSVHVSAAFMHYNAQ